MTIKRLEDKPQSKKIDIDLTGPDGNAYVLLSLAWRLGKQMGFSEHRIILIQDEMKLADYECLLQTFDREFGSFVNLWR